MIRVAIIVGTTRPGRKALAVAEWVQRRAGRRADASIEIVDLADHGLPQLDEPDPPTLGRYANPHTRPWAERIEAFDAFVFVTPEYNHSVPGALKNALDFLGAEWHQKVAAFVSYGGDGGARAVEHLRTIVAALRMAGVYSQVTLSLFSDFRDLKVFAPHPRHDAELQTMLDELLSWAQALKALREPPATGTDLERPRRFDASERQPVGASPATGNGGGKEGRR